MVFIDALNSEWKPITLLCKTNAATRRIPICLISDDAATRAEALLSGAELALSRAEVQADLEALLADFARVPDAEKLARLECECGQALPPMALEGVALFNRGEYYRQHDLFEALWMETAGPARDLYRAILQVGVAYYQIERGNYRGALKMLQRSVQWLYPLPDVCQGVDVAQLRRDSYAVRGELQRLGADRLDEFDRSLIKNLRWRAPQSPRT